MDIQADDDSHQSDSVESNRSTQHRVLVVDDDPIILLLVSNMLSAIGFHVEQASGGIQAKQCLSQRKFDVVVTDLKMPDMDGYALSDWLKREAPDTSVVMMTGCTSSEVAHYMNKDLVDCWIFKPFDLDHLRKVMGEMVRKPDANGR